MLEMPMDGRHMGVPGFGAALKKDRKNNELSCAGTAFRGTILPSGPAAQRPSGPAAQRPSGPNCVSRQPAPSTRLAAA